MTDERIQQAEAFLTEAVYRSRGRQAVDAALSPAASGEVGRCGLGEKAAVVLDLDPRGRELFEQLFGALPDDDASESRLEGIRDALKSWVKRQDALDRTRNHFLKAFRQEHGFDRTAYTKEELAAYESGLEEVNERARDELRSQAEALLG
jgi:hypothetical protein